MNSSVFTFLYHFLAALVVGLHMGNIHFLSPAVIALVLSRYSCCKVSYDGFSSSILRDVI
jgi:hypothetical protein